MVSHREAQSKITLPSESYPYNQLFTSAMVLFLGILFVLPAFWLLIQIFLSIFRPSELRNIWSNPPIFLLMDLGLAAQAGAALYFGWRAWHAAVEIDDDGLYVRGVLFDQWYDWGSIHGKKEILDEDGWNWYFVDVDGVQMPYPSFGYLHPLHAARIHELIAAKVRKLDRDKAA